MNVTVEERVTILKQNAQLITENAKLYEIVNYLKKSMVDYERIIIQLENCIEKLKGV